MEGLSVMQEKGRYRRWGVIGRLCCTWDMVSEEGYAANLYAPKTKDADGEEEVTGRSTVCDALESRILSAYDPQRRRRKNALLYSRRKKESGKGILGTTRARLSSKDFSGAYAIRTNRTGRSYCYASTTQPAIRVEATIGYPILRWERGDLRKEEGVGDQEGAEQRSARGGLQFLRHN